MKRYFSILLLLFSCSLHAQNPQQFVRIGDFKTTSGGVIRDCRIGYRTIGKLKKDKSNAVLWPSWYTGTSETVSPAVVNLIDTTGLYVIVVDSFGNGISSSPSNTPNFPVITIKDMVKAEYIMLKEKMKIDHLHAVMGISMGGMQTFEWINLYPDFMDRAIPIVGTPKETFYDNLVWESCVQIIEEAKRDHRDMDVAMQSVTNIQFMNMFTPEYWNRSHPVDSLYSFLAQSYMAKKDPDNYLSQLKAMITHDIYKEAKTPLQLKCKMLVVVASQDHLVNPGTSIEFAKTHHTQLSVIDGYFGHMSTVYVAGEMRKSIAPFLSK